MHWGLASALTQLLLGLLNLLSCVRYTDRSPVNRANSNQLLCQYPSKEERSEREVGHHRKALILHCLAQKGLFGDIGVKGKRGIGDITKWIEIAPVFRSKSAQDTHLSS